MENIIVALLGGLALVLAGVIPAAINAKKARKHAERMSDQITPSNGTKLHEYIENTDRRLEHLIELVIEARDEAAAARDRAAEAANVAKMHEAVYRHEAKE